MIDFHSHLDLYQDPLSVVKICQEDRMFVLSVTTTPSAWKGTSELAPSDSRIRTALGLHPQIAHERKIELALFDEYLPGAPYVGEIGLDGSEEFKLHWNDQLDVFNHILRACSREGGRIMSIHCRRAASAVLDHLEAAPDAGIPVLHWFTGNLRELHRAIEMGCWFSVGPAMLLAQRSRRLVSLMPRDRVLTESDGPFAQVSGRQAMPWDVRIAIDQLVTIWGMSLQATEESLFRNLRQLTTAL